MHSFRKLIIVKSDQIRKRTRKWLVGTAPGDRKKEVIENMSEWGKAPHQPWQIHVHRSPFFIEHTFYWYGSTGCLMVKAVNLKEWDSLRLGKT